MGEILTPNKTTAELEAKVRDYTWLVERLTDSLPGSVALAESDYGNRIDACYSVDDGTSRMRQMTMVEGDVETRPGEYQRYSLNELTGDAQDKAVAGIISAFKNVVVSVTR